MRIFHPVAVACGLACSFVITCSASASPRSELISLVPGDAQIVLGIEDPHNTQQQRLLVVTHNNNLDFADWLALVSSDASMTASELLEVASSSPRGELKEHLLIANGRFDRERIFRAAQQNGAAASECRGEAILAISPFSRERKQMRETRWLAILDNRVALFGTPLLVAEAIERRHSHAAPDPRFVAGLSRLGGDVTSWNLLAMPPDLLAHHLNNALLGSRWAELVGRTDEIAIGLHFGATVRMDFTAHAIAGVKSIVSASYPNPQFTPAAMPQIAHAHLQRLAIEDDRVVGSITLPQKAFDTLAAQAGRDVDPIHGMK